MPSDLPDRRFENDAERDAWIATVRAKVKPEAEARNLSLSQVADESGVKYGTLTPWLTGKYAGDNARIAVEMERWLLSSEERRHARMAMPDAPGFVITETARRIMGVLAQAQHMPDFVVVAAAPGLGKTEAAKKFQKANPNVFRMTAQPCHGTVRALVEGLALAIPGATPSALPDRVTRTIVSVLRSTKGLLIVDEAQHLPLAAHDQLRTIHDLAEVGVALVGDTTLHLRLKAAERTGQYAQLTSRIGMRLLRPKPFKADIEALLDAWKVEEKAVRAPLTAIAAQPGALRQMTKTLRIAHVLAGEEGGGLGVKHVEAAWAQLSDRPLGTAEAA